MRKKRNDNDEIYYLINGKKKTEKKIGTFKDNTALPQKLNKCFEINCE